MTPRGRFDAARALLEGNGGVAEEEMTVRSMSRMEHGVGVKQDVELG